MGNRYRSYGFTLPEIVITISLFSILFWIIAVNLTSIQKNTTITSAMDTFIADLREQQIKAMMGDTEGLPAAESYGIQIGTNTYTLFHGSSFNPSDSANLTVTLANPLQFSSPGASIIFSNTDGKIRNYSNMANTLTIFNSKTFEQKELFFNGSGVITGLQ